MSFTAEQLKMIEHKLISRSEIARRLVAGPVSDPGGLLAALQSCHRVCSEPRETSAQGESQAAGQPLRPISKAPL
jgi:hypothetical protein